MAKNNEVGGRTSFINRSNKDLSRLGILLKILRCVDRNKNKTVKRSCFKKLNGFIW